MEFSAPMAGKTVLVAVLVVVAAWWIVFGGLATMGSIVVLLVVLAVVGLLVYSAGIALWRRWMGRLEGSRGG